MLATPNDPILQLEGIDQQNFEKLQLVKGTFPFQIGLQQRMPGKTLQKIYDHAVGSIYVFYSVFGRHYTLIDFGSISIIEVTPPPIVLPGTPPTSTLDWIDTFSGYAPALISRLWGAGIWPIGVGICESIIEAFYDPFLVYAKISVPVDTSTLPVPGPSPDGDPSIPPISPTSPDALYPPGYVDVILHIIDSHKNNSCTGQGTQLYQAVGSLRLRNYSGGPAIDQITANSITIGTRVTFHGVKVGRDANSDIGLVGGSCVGPPLPTPIDYSLYVNTGELLLDS